VRAMVNLLALFVLLFVPTITATTGCCFFNIVEVGPLSLSLTVGGITTIE
jgi:hypothetical protein